MTIIMVGQRIARWLKMSRNKETFILLPYYHSLTEVYISSVHNLDHKGIESILANAWLAASPFYHTGLDLFSSFTVSDAVKRRTRRKAVRVIFTCLVTRAMHLEPAEGYSNFLASLRKCTSHRRSHTHSTLITVHNPWRQVRC